MEEVFLAQFSMSLLLDNNLFVSFWTAGATIVWGHQEEIPNSYPLFSKEPKLELQYCQLKKASPSIKRAWRDVTLY